MCIRDSRYAVTKMQQSPELERKLFYFSVLFGEAQRVLNWEWNTDLALIHMITQQVHAQVNRLLQTPGLLQTLPIDLRIVFDKLTQVASALATYFEKAENKEELHRILGGLAEISFATTGNGSYLYDKGAFKL